MKIDDAIRSFGMSAMMIESEMRQLERSLDVNLGHRDRQKEAIDQAYYPQFSERLREEAARMTTHYAIFYCLENTIRSLIAERLKDVGGATWWDQCVPEVVRKNAEANRKKELQTGVTPRSDDLIDYTNFGELGEIIKANWATFDMFSEQRAVERVLNNLNTLRAPIAHCKALADDEVMRLHLSLRDWFRLME